MKINKEGEVQKDNMHMLIFVVSLNCVFATYLVFKILPTNTVRTMQSYTQRSFRKPDRKGEKGC